MVKDPNPPATAEIVELYNSLRSKILLLYDLRLVHLNCDFELQAARWRLDTFAPDQPLPRGLASVTVPTPPNASRPVAPGQGNDLDNPSSTMSSAITTQIDPAILTALRECDSKRPIVPRYSLGVAGTLAAAAGTAGLAMAVSNHATGGALGSEAQGANLSGSTRKSTCPSPKLTAQSPDSVTLSAARSPSVHSQSTSDSPAPHRATPSRSVSGGSAPGGSSVLSSAPSTTEGAPESAQRRRRAAALEQSRVLKKLKIKGHLVD
ncbi:unnamed protein product [Echinostoma caproni]|uniref:DMAP1 domain-containing protein n=1 Tax=Echinostoma caproni TaxID=27848 RepID=A0A183AGX7_9TREM|nr:unnamed protein product [Echinostoma caproni]